MIDKFAKIAVILAISALAGAACSSQVNAHTECMPELDGAIYDASLAPYSSGKFRQALDNTRALQIYVPGSCLSRSDIQANGYDADNWRLNRGNMEFLIDNWGDHKRVELRGENFASNLTKTFESTVQVGVRGYSAGFSFAQIFSEDTTDPILKVQMIRRRGGMKNHVWGIYRTGTGDAAFEYQDLGPAPEKEAQTLVLQYNINGSVSAKLGDNPKRTWTKNMNFWTVGSKNTYFKAGCYLRYAGNCRVVYSSLKF